MKPFITPKDVEEHLQHEGNMELLQDLSDACARALLDEWSGDRVLVEYPANTPERVKTKLKQHIEASGWVVKFYDGQRDVNSNGTYNLEIKKP